jgi:transcriptional regulator GlxA family with amidase domain
MLSTAEPASPKELLMEGLTLEVRALRSRFLNETILKRLHYYPRALEVVLYAQSLLPETVRLEDVAMRCGMRPACFSRFFTEKIGITFSATLKILRIQRAVEALERQDCSIEVIATGSGYGSGCSFARAFKEVVGETPTEYRRRVLN